MPKKLERQLKRQARKKGFVKDGLSERGQAYVYGTLRKTGWKPSREKHNPAVGLEMGDKGGHADIEGLLRKI